MSHTEYTTEADDITATVVPESARLDTLPKYFGVRYMLVTESAIMDQMRALSQQYTGGVWEFYELSNGGFYMAPSGTETFEVQVYGNGYIGTMSADAAGITATLFALSNLAFQTSQAVFSDRFHQLREFAARHFEASEIFRACD